MFSEMDADKFPVDVNAPNCWLPGRAAVGPVKSEMPQNLGGKRCQRLRTRGRAVIIELPAGWAEPFTLRVVEGNPVTARGFGTTFCKVKTHPFATPVECWIFIENKEEKSVVSSMHTTTKISPLSLYSSCSQQTPHSLTDNPS